ncbi:CinA family protein [Novosphingobium sp. 9]|uniref:CinA family protein n=1 Tax=Novosphingobium sp. 9 TaxID=2025349 RepID=UPI0021B53C73|nr:CinA family protein [Novosphingobium sp. 9]
MAQATLLPSELIELAQRVIDENKAAGRRVALAESCTGGLVCAALTEIAGSSAVLDRGFVTYSNEAKTDLLGVSPDLLDAVGAVSPAVAWAMAQGAIERSDADVAVAISGIAGPDGGSDAKPVGTVVFSRAHRVEEEINAEQRLMNGKNRSEIRLQAAIVALKLLLPENDGITVD